MAPRLTQKQLTRAVNDLRLAKVLSIDALVDVTARNPRHRAVAMLRPHLERAQKEPTRSDLEDAFLKLVRKYRLPTPEINVHVAGHRVDALYRDHNFVVELDGWAAHKTRHAFIEDRRQDAEILAMTGMPAVRLPYDDTIHRAGATAERLQQIFRRAELRSD